VACLIISTNGKELYRRPLAGPVTLGRSIDCELWVNDAGISRNHCRFTPIGDAWEVQDLGSRNGVFVHGQRVTKQLLRDGDDVRIGDAKVTFHEFGFVPVRPVAPTPSIDPMAETVAHPRPSQVIARRAPRPAQPSRTMPDLSVDSSVDSGLERAQVTPLPFTRPTARPIPVAQKEAAEDHSNGERSRGRVRRWLQK